MDRAFLSLTITILVPIAGAMGYVHGTFATIERVRKVEKLYFEKEEKLDNIHSLLCKMAIRQRLEEAVEICTKQ